MLFSFVNVILFISINSVFLAWYRVIIPVRRWIVSNSRSPIVAAETHLISCQTAGFYPFSYKLRDINRRFPFLFRGDSILLEINLDFLFVRDEEIDVTDE